MTLPEPAILTVDGSGLLCVQLLLRLRKQIADVTPGTVVEVITTDPAAPLDLPAWCHLTGHGYLGTVAGEVAGEVAGVLSQTHRVQIATDARRTKAEHPWHPVRPRAAASGAISAPDA